MPNVMNIAAVMYLGFDEVSFLCVLGLTWNKVRMGESVIQWHMYLSSLQG